jgi:hypothetical protein
MAIDKRSRPQPISFTIRDNHPVCDSSARRCFYIYDKSKASHCTKSNFPSILRRRMKYSKASPFRLVTSKVNNENIYRSSTSNSSSCQFPAVKRIKIIFQDEDQNVPATNEAVPASFSPPPFNNHIMVRPKAVTPPPPVSSHKVSFFHKVQVLRIPSRKQYPDEMKKSLWATLSEISENAKRNSIEYTAEGWDWRTVLEEKDMYRHPRTGEYVHPVHVQREYQKRMMIKATGAIKQRKSEDSSIDISQASDCQEGGAV